MVKVALPSGLRSLTFGEDFNLSMEIVVLPSGLQGLAIVFVQTATQASSFQRLCEGLDLDAADCGSAQRFSYCAVISACEKGQQWLRKSGLCQRPAELDLRREFQPEIGAWRSDSAMRPAEFDL